MIREWIRRHRQAATTVTGGAVVLALLTGFALVSDGYDAQRVDLDDGSVWVVNSAQQAIGRANTSVLELDSVVDSRSEDIDVLQSGSTVLLADRGSSRLDVVDDATSEVIDTAPLPAGAEVMLAGSRAAILVPATGQLWLVPVAGLSAFDAAGAPTLMLGADAVASMGDDGTLLVYSAATGTLSRIPAATDDTVQETVDVGRVGAPAAAEEAAGDPAADPATALAGETVAAGDAGRPAGQRLALTAVDGHWALYDADARTLLVDGRTVDLAGSIAADARVALQRASVDGSGVLVAHTGGLVEVPVAGGDPVVVPGGGRGDPARPVRVDGCEHAGWTDGSGWERCPGADGTTAALASMPAQASLRFLVDGARVVLNDVRGGAAWAVQQGAGLIDNWSDLIDRDRSDTVVEQNTADTPPETDRVQQPPVAVDDELGARPGRTTALPVLLNDHDPNGDVLVIDSVTPVDAEVGVVDIVDDGQGLQLALAPSASGTVRFSYAISDGRGGTATADVRVAVRTAEENAPPVQAQPATGTVAEGARLQTDVLGGWYDPDGDPMYLTRASVAAPDAVSWKPEGRVVYTDAGSGGDTRTVALQVSDGREEGSGELVVTVRRADDVPLVAEGFVVQAQLGREITVEPLTHARGGNGAIRLAAVPARAGVVITPDLEAGTFRLQGGQAGTHLLEYTVTDGQTTATGVVRVEVRGAPASDGRPVTVPHTVFVRALQATDVDVLATDFDPAGGVLVITDAASPGDAVGVRAEVVGQRLVRISLTRPLDGPVDVEYRVSNGVAEATGVITVIEVPEPAVRQPPVATDDRVAVRVGDAVDIPVLANDEQPDGDRLRLDPVLVDPLPEGAGLLFASEDRLRYLAPDRTGDYTAVYRAVAPDGQWATATLTVSVREADAATNAAPVPRPLTARVLAGETVRIPVPLTGIDPDGDSVRLLGQDTGPEKGQVTEVGPDWIDYQAGDYSTGTDAFAYAVVDGLGARATGTVRVGISPRVEGARNPVATADTVTVRPGRVLRVQVLANDTDPDGGALSLVSVQPQEAGLVAGLDGDTVRVVAPDAAGRYGFVYGVRNARGGTDEAFLTVIVDPAAPPTRPVARDTVLQLSDVLDRSSVDVDVMRSVFSAEGDVSALVLGVGAGYEDVAGVTADGRIRVEVGDERRIVPFTVAQPDDPSISATAFIWVPGFEDTLPQLRVGQPRPTVASGERLVVDLADQVVAAGGRAVRIADPNSLSATHADGPVELVDEDTIAYRSEPGYFGPAAISFTVTDGSGAGADGGRTAALVLPITVTPTENQPPVLTGAVIDLEPGQSKDVDLGRLTTYPYQDDRGQLSFALEGAVADGFRASVDGGTLRISAEEGVATGAAASFPVSVRDATQTGRAGRVDLRVVPSTRPLPQPATDTGSVTRGSTTVIDVLANDQAGNPFPGTPLTVASIRGADGASLPEGVTVTPSADRATLTVSASADAAPGDVRVQYEVRDATGDPGRAAFGTVVISVQDRPGPVSALRASGFADRSLTVAFEPGAFNGSPITGYQVRVLRGGTATATITCPSTTCTVPTPGNGPSDAVEVEVQAVNGVGASDPVSLAGLWSDVLPAAPAGLTTEPLVDGLRVSWQPAAVPSSSSPVTQHVVSVGGITRQVAADATSVEVRDPSLVPEVPVAVSVAARNSAQVQDASAWLAATATGTPRAAPTATGTPTATPDADDETRVTVSWPAFQGPGVDGIRYLVAAYAPGSAPGCSVATEGASPWSPEHGPAVDVGTATSHVFTGLAPDQPVAFAVLAANSQGCTVVEAGQLTPRTAPSTPVVSVSLPDRDRGSDGVFRAVLADARYRPGNAQASAQLLYRVDGQGDGVPIGVGQALTLPRTGVGASIQVRVVEDSGDGRPRSSGWSDPVDAGTAVDARAGDVQFATDAAGGTTVSWTSTPTAAGPGARVGAGGGYARSEVRCGGQGAWTDASSGAAGSCAIPATGERILEVRVTANSGTLYTYAHRG
ncbi:fibronectin type III domain-containing protein [Clavibacter michiganensis]|uniref:Ig-like domain-containing protein n=1 Tax=Clavibacter michiganensis TaxID=28447 RepID=UPI000CE8F58F|nr:Ig-like domain-containing protein [Clavibacter michiganensis]PPF50246.1 fibronectin type III domain-containing protein [Clavibacter michiganensis]